MASLPGQKAGSIPVGPTTPGSLTAISVPTGVQLSWFSSQDGDVPLAYIISRCSGAACTNFTVLNTTPNGASSFTDQTVASFTSYSYTISATDASGNTSGFSNIATIVTPDVTSPTAPALGFTNTTTSVTLTWSASTDPDDPVVQYNVSRSINSSPFTLLTSLTATTLTDSSLAAGTYQYFVTAQDSNGNVSVPSNTITAILADTTAPTVPTGLSTIAVSGSQINLSWNPSTDDSGIVNHYNIVRNGVAVGTSPTTTFSDTGLNNFTTYAYQVSASDTSNNTSALCPVVNATTLDTIAPTVPGNFTAVAISSSEIDLAWTTSSDSGSGVATYTITRNPGNFTFQVGPSILSFKDLGLNSVTTYSYSLSATDNAGNSSATTSASATTQSSSASSFNPNFPRVGFMGIGSTSTLNQFNNVGGLLNLYGRYNIFCFGGDFEAWTVNASGGDRDVMINTVKVNSTAHLGTKVLIYGKMNSYLPGDTSYQTWQNVMLNSNFPLYLNGSSGTIAVEAGGGKNLIDYAESVVGTAYAGNTVGIGQNWTPAQYSAYYQYYYKLNKTRTGTIPSLFSAISPNDASPKFDGIQMDNFFLDPGVAADWKRNGTQSTFDNGSYQGTFSDILINGQRDFLNTLSSLITAGGGNQWLCANAGGYSRADAGVTLANTGVMKGVLNYSFFEGAIGKNFAIDTFSSYANLQNNTAQLFAFLKDPFAVMHNHCLPNGTAAQSGNLPWSATKTAVNGEYQWARYMITTSLQSNSYCSIQYQTSGYNAEITDLTWYDEYDNVGTLKGYLGQPIDAVQNGIRVWYDGTTVANVWAREYQNGLAITVARTGIGAVTQPSGTITITGAQLGLNNGKSWIRINGTQAPAVNNGQVVTSAGVTLQASRDGIILLKNVPNWILPASHSIASPMALTLLGPRTGMVSIRYQKAYPGILYRVPVVALGGKYPYQYTLSGQPAGMTIGQHFGDTDYGIINWSNPVVGSFSYTVTVTDQAGTAVSTTVSLTVTTTGFIFFDAVNGHPSTFNNGTADGSIGNPFKDLNDWWWGAAGAAGTQATRKADTRFKDFICYYKNGTYTTASCQTTEGFGTGTISGFRVPMVVDNKPKTHLAFPGHSPVWDVTAAALQIYGDNGYGWWMHGITSTGVNDSSDQKFIAMDAGTTDTVLFENTFGPQSGTSGNNPTPFMITANRPTIAKFVCIVNNTYQGLSGCEAVELYDTQLCAFHGNSIRASSEGNGGGAYFKEDCASFSVRGNFSPPTPNNLTGLCRYDNFNTELTAGTQAEICWNNYETSGPAILFGTNGNNWGTVGVFRNTWRGQFCMINGATGTGSGTINVSGDVNIGNGTAANNWSLTNWAGSLTFDANYLTGTAASGIVDSSGNLIGSFRTSNLGLSGHEVA